MNLQIFNFEKHQVRTVLRNGEPYFVAADVCAALNLGNTSMALNRLDDDERTLISIEGASNGLPVNVVSETGLYNLILSSRKPEAKAFRRWVTHEVLPAIRRTGTYSTAPDQAALPTDYLSALESLVIAERSRIALLATVAQQSAALEEAQPKVDFYNQVVASNDAISIRAASKLLNIEGVGQIKLFSFLRQQKVLMTNNQPYQEYIDRGWFRVIESSWRDPHGNHHVYLQTLVYQKGIDGIRRLYEKHSTRNVIQHPGYAIGAPGARLDQ